MRGIWQIKKIVSGGQTGVDRAALDVGLILGIPVGGYCPLGRLAEDGTINSRYPLNETPSSEYAQRTEWNVRHSDATLVLSTITPAGGTLLTIQHAQSMNRPLLLVDPRTGGIAEVHSWMKEHHPKTLNIAGPRESLAPGIYADASRFIISLLRLE